MSSHRIVRALTERLAAMILVALLAGLSVLPCGPGLAAARDVSSAQDTGMSAPPGPTASAALSIAPAALAAPLSAAVRVVVIEFEPIAGGRPTDRVLRPPMAPKPAPTILRV
jgi:hypothetical protein